MCDAHGPMEQYISEIRELDPEAALYEQLAEECCELAHAALKKARKLRDESHTPKTMEEIDADLEEEYTDVRLTANVCGLAVNWTEAHYKAKRWTDRDKKAVEKCK